MNEEGRLQPLTGKDNTEEKYVTSCEPNERNTTGVS